MGWPYDHAMTTATDDDQADTGAGRSVLRLLADGATAQELSAAATGQDERDLILRIRAEIEQAHRRERELEALVDIAADLSAFDDPSSVLETIVRRARGLLGTDLAYLTLFDEAVGDTYMRATAGSLSARFQTLRLEAGVGLGGLAATTRRAYWTQDYWDDDRFRHTAQIDSGVREEGIVAICGVPLVVRDAFVGVLFAANRSVRPFSREEVSLLSSLATLAAVTIVQVQARDQAARALHDLSDAHATVQQQAAGVERAASAHDRFADLVLHGGGVDDITSALTELLGGWAAYVDSTGRVHSRSGPVPQSHPALVEAAENTGRADRLHSVEGCWLAPVGADGRDLGALVVGGIERLDSADRRTVERAAVVSALVLLIQINRAEARQQLRTDLVADLLDGRGDPEQVTRAAAVQGVDLDSPVVVLVGRPGPASSRSSVTMAANAALDQEALVGEYRGHVVAVLNATDPSASAGRLADRMRAGFRLSVGGAGPVTGAAAVRDSYAEATRAVDALVALGRDGAGAAVADLGFAGLVVAADPDIAQFVDRVLGPLQDYDQTRGTDLMKTAAAYFRAGRSPRHAAGELHVHVNTVTQRIDRIGRLLGTDWQSPDRSLEVQLALRLRQLIDR